ncbi:hypothetical protein RHGRI_025369 [Rhododendron griersonianum]|uniref:Uncharacterized protein n=1 Tax=Rhododendron griersonianum TaxID=479676 RepID=A0AAV6INS1_9ERIC|nr:hypothetical protein RHGRI_025369 [Rhododendron griersonianum]
MRFRRRRGQRLFRVSPSDSSLRPTPPSVTVFASSDFSSDSSLRLVLRLQIRLHRLVMGRKLVRGKGKAKQLDSISDEEDTKEQTCDEEVSKGIIETDTIPNPPKKLKTKKLAGRKPIEVTSSSVPKAEFSKRHAQSQYDFRVRSPKNQGINIDQAAPQSQPLRKRPRIVVETQETQATEASQHIAFNRCNMQAMIRLMKGFPVTPALKDSLKKTPFWHLINAFIVEKVKSDHCRKFDEVVVKIVESYDSNTRTFRLGNKHVKLEREDVKLIFGLHVEMRR